MSSSLTPIAEPDDVRGEIDTDVEDPRLETYLSDAIFEIDQVVAVDTLEDDLQRQLEKKIAAMKVLSRDEREVESHSRETGERSYGVSTFEQLEREVNNIDPTDGDILDNFATTIGFRTFGD